MPPGPAVTDCRVLRPRAQNWDVTPLHLALGSGHVRCARLLIEKGADIEARDHVRSPGVPSTLALEQSNALPWLRVRERDGPPEAEAGRHPHAQEGSTALLWATASGHARAVQLLLEFGADKNTRNSVRGRGGEPALRWVVSP